MILPREMMAEPDFLFILFDCRNPVPGVHKADEQPARPLPAPNHPATKL
jgi:hypothetical protein